ncbi:hypothetical protein ASE95_16395 [Sphingomonas sp. Leaf231]|nr:hypothetical protein ASE95_16395 [Sphingomonas sp. Leaf231]
MAASATVTPLERKTVSLALANRFADAAIASCHAIGREAVVAIVDRGGNLITLPRGDDIGPHNSVAAQRKAFTALSTKSSTAALAERAATDPTSRNLLTIPELLLLGGGIPLRVGNEVIGGIGVAGSGGAANDERCATDAIAQVLVPAGERR